jgi:hypothetical protein
VEYPTATSAGLAAVYDDAFRKNPEKASFSGRAVRVFLNQAGGSPVVAEVGGRNGALAKVALESTPSIKRWINYEISEASVLGGVTKDPRYEARFLTDFRWWRSNKMEGDILIMSHVIEHLTDEDFKDLAVHIPANIKGVHVQAPIPMRGPTNWKGFNGAHILALGWVEVDQVFTAHSFRPIPAYDGASWMRR